MPEFNHLHVHTQFSLLDGAAKIKNLTKKAASQGHKFLAITDHGNMYGVPQFVNQAQANGLHPIIGSEFYLGEDLQKEKETKIKSKVRYHQIIWAKNEIGYKNLSRLSSLGFIDGYYYHPRIDKALIRKYSEGLMASTCCLAGEIPRAIIEKGEEAAEKLFNEWLDIFGDDYYIELQRHDIKEQNICNEVLIRWSKKYNVKVLATNDVHYIEKKDSTAQDILLCLQTGKDFDDPNRMRFENDQFFLKTGEEMADVFKDVPDAIENTVEFAEKIKPIDINREILLPLYKLPDGFTSQDDYLKHLTFEGAKIKYGEITATIEERLTYELGIIKTMGFPGYFLIVQDFINAAKNIGVAVGPGRGSAAGSAVAYCVGITDIDPIKYSLLFERFLNPERVSMPDIDIDFDDRGRQKVIDYVIDKYGRNQVAQIVTFGTMAAKSSIRDVSRVLGLPLSEADRIAKLIPERPGVSLAEAFNEVKELADIKNNLLTPEGKVLSFAETLEGSARHTGIHAAGVIIAPDDLLNHIPVKGDRQPDENGNEGFITQYEGKYVEDCGMLKMDFLGLKTLTIITDAITMIKKNHGVEIDIEKIDLEDIKTFELYQRGDTIGTFQFESEGMRQWLEKLKPTTFEDLIAMNALYRPGPMDYIPDFIDRKHGKKKVSYPHPLLEDILSNSYGIMVYQEQIMQTAQILAGYSLGSADILRRIMGKKKLEEMDKQRVIFVKGAKEKNNIEKETAEEIFSIMEKFASYGFNRSHAAAYSLVAFQTGYLKAHYPAEYMASVLTHNQNALDKITFFIDECKRIDINVLGPDVNKSGLYFDVDNDGQIRFGIAAIKGTGEIAAEAIIQERDKNGPYTDIFDFSTRINLRTVNKKTWESMAMAGAFDCYEDLHRRMLLEQPAGDISMIEKLIRYGNGVQEEKNSPQQSLFGAAGDTESIPHPKLYECEPYPEFEKLRIEKDMVGFYISGHPLNQFQIELDNFCTCSLNKVYEIKDRDISVGAIISRAMIRQNKSGKEFSIITLEDHSGTLEFALFGENHLKWKHLLNVNQFLYVKGNVKSRYNQEDVFELRPSSIELLSDIREKLGKGIMLIMEIDTLEDGFVNAFEEAVKDHPGNALLKIKLIDHEDKINVDLFSRKYRVNLGNSFFERINQIGNLSYKIIT